MKEHWSEIKEMLSQRMEWNFSPLPRWLRLLSDRSLMMADPACWMKPVGSEFPAIQDWEVLPRELVEPGHYLLEAILVA